MIPLIEDCPFCRSRCIYVDWRRDGSRVRCDSCGCSGPMFLTDDLGKDKQDDGAIKAWNNYRRIIDVSKE